MESILSAIDTNDPEFEKNRTHHLNLADDLRQRLAQVRQGGGGKYRERHEAQGKLFVRERIDRLLDPGSPFLELSPLAAWVCMRTRLREQEWSPASGGWPTAR